MELQKILTSKLNKHMINIIDSYKDNTIYKRSSLKGKRRSHKRSSLKRKSYKCVLSKKRRSMKKKI